MNDDRSMKVGAIVLPLDSAATRLMVVLLAMVVVLALGAGVLALNGMGHAEADAGYAKAKAEDSLLEAQRAEREARLAEYYAVDLKEYMAQNGLHPPADPWGKRKGPDK